jgi:hypothetical protein
MVEVQHLMPGVGVVPTAQHLLDAAAPLRLPRP